MLRDQEISSSVSIERLLPTLVVTQCVHSAIGHCSEPVHVQVPITRRGSGTLFRRGGGQTNTYASSTQDAQRATQSSGTCCCEWECPHCMQAASKICALATSVDWALALTRWPMARTDCSGPVQKDVTGRPSLGSDILECCVVSFFVGPVKSHPGQYSSGVQ